MRQGGLIEAAQLNETPTEYIEYFDINLTWHGQEFLDVIHDNALWRMAKETIIKPGISFTFDLLFSWLEQKAKVHLGLS